MGGIGEKMNVSLKTKLTISYVMLSLFLVTALLAASNYIIEKKFESYIINLQEKKNTDIVNLVVHEFGNNGEIPNYEILENLGNTALSQGLVLMVSDADNKELFCMSNVETQMCDDMLADMRDHMASVYPGFNGEYEQKDYDIIKNNIRVGTVTLGYYGPFYYNDEDIQFLSMLNKIFFTTALVFFVIAILFGRFMANKISGPIRKVIDRTKKIQSGDYSERLPMISDTKEIRQLIQSVNALADTLERQHDSKKQMVSNYAHELRTPLATLQSGLEAMIDGIWEPTEERLESCREEILRLTRMISDIDKLVKIENDNDILTKTKFDIATVTEQTVINFMPEITSKGIEVRTYFNKCEIYADRDKIIQVIINLLSNAVKYTDKGGIIEITTGKNKDKALIKVTDTGIGISKQDIPDIFEYLFRTDKSRDRSTGGHGIGLSVVKAIVDAHGGNITVKSELSKGSEFQIELPL